jgi:hypothetical protein
MHKERYIYIYISNSWVTVAERSKAWTVFTRSGAGIVGSNPTQGMDVWCVYAFILCCVVLCLDRGLAISWSLVQGVLPSVKWSWNWKQRPGPKGAVESVEKTYNSRQKGINNEINKYNKCTYINEGSKKQIYLRKEITWSSHRDDIHSTYLVWSNDILWTVQFQTFSGHDSITVHVRTSCVPRHTTKSRITNKDCKNPTVFKLKFQFSIQ